MNEEELKQKDIEWQGGYHAGKRAGIKEQKGKTMVSIEKANKNVRSNLIMNYIYELKKELGLEQ